MPSVPVTAPLSRAEQHAALARVALSQGARSSVLTNGVSLHTMPQSVSFGNLRTILSTAQSQGHGQCIFVGSRDGCLCVSVNFNYEPLRPCGSRTSGRKRSRDPLEEAIEQAVLRVKKGLKGDHEAVTDDTLASAQRVLYTLVSRLRGAGGEEVVESWGISLKKMEVGATIHRPRLIVSARIAPGVAVPLATLFSCLGIRCTSDGLLTVQDNTSLASGFNLPLGEGARAAELHGQRAITLCATVGV